MRYVKMDEIENIQIKFEPFIIYESIVSIGHPERHVVNSACMGVHFTPTDEVYLHVYEDSHTRQLMKSGTKFSINFTDSFTEYAKAALLRKECEEIESEIDIENFSPLTPTPILKSAWCAVECEVIEKGPSLIKKPPCRRRQEPNVRAKITKKHVFAPPQIFNNRSMNLALEALILSTRIPFCEPFSDEYKFSLRLYKHYKQKINEWRDIDRFEEGFEYMDNYLIDNGVKPQDIFDMAFK